MDLCECQVIPAGFFYHYLTAGHQTFYRKAPEKGNAGDDEYCRAEKGENP